jgi:hypothetical protein
MINSMMPAAPIAKRLLDRPGKQVLCAKFFRNFKPDILPKSFLKYRFYQTYRLNVFFKLSILQNMSKIGYNGRQKFVPINCQCEPATSRSALSSRPMGSAESEPGDEAIF